MVAARKQLKESLAARDEALRYYGDMVSYLDQSVDREFMAAARHYADGMAQRRRNRKAIADATAEQKDNVLQQRGIPYGAVKRAHEQEEANAVEYPVTAERNYPTREEIETAAKVCEQLGHRVTALALRHRLERESDG